MVGRLLLVVVLTWPSLWTVGRPFSTSLQSQFKGQIAQLNAHVAQGPHPQGVRTQSPVTARYPFKPGEKLVYDIGFQKSILSGAVGKLELEVRYSADNESSPPPPAAGPAIARDRASSNDRDPEAQASKSDAAPGPDGELQDYGIEFKGTLTSKGFYTWVLGVNVQDSYQSIVSARDLSLSRFVKITDQSNQHRREETSVDRAQGLATYTDVDANNTAAEPKTKIVSCPPWVLDILSAFYFVRAQNLKDGQTLTIPLTDSGRVFDIELVAGTHETVDFKSGKTRALPVDVRIFDGRYVKRNGQLIVWLSDDPSHVPVRARVKLNGLTINVVLEQLPV